MSEKPSTADARAAVFKAREVAKKQAARMLTEYRKRVGWWCRHEPSCQTRGECDARLVSTWKARGQL